MRRAAILAPAALALSATLGVAAPSHAQQYLNWSGRGEAPTAQAGVAGAQPVAARRANPVIPHGGFAHAEAPGNRLTPAPGSDGRLTPATAWLGRQPDLGQPRPAPSVASRADVAAAPAPIPTSEPGDQPYGAPAGQPSPAAVSYPSAMPSPMGPMRSQPDYQPPAAPEARPVYNEAPPAILAPAAAPAAQPVTAAQPLLAAQPVPQPRPQPAAARPGYTPVPVPGASQADFAPEMMSGPAPSAPEPVPADAPPAADPYAPRRDAPIFRMQQRADLQPSIVAQPVEAPAPSPAAPPARAEESAPQTRQADQPRTVAMVQPNAADRPPTQSGSRYYSVHRSAGRTPDAVTLPAPTYVDALTVTMDNAPTSPDLAQPDQGPTLIRDVNGRVRAAPAASDGDHQ